MDRRDLLAHEALERLPKILGLQDRNPHSPTYGCFDRNFWHYRIIDFPTGMAQEMVWPLALAYSLPYADNPYRGRDALAEWVTAGIVFAAETSHRDGSCDDYFPFERAGGAASFSLLAAMESYKLIGLDDPKILDFFARRSDWLADFHESGRLTNHQALVALCLAVAGRLLGTDKWENAHKRRIERILAWQHPEGWFQEYEGFDPGYQTITISLLAWIHDLDPNADVKNALTQAVGLAGEVMFPDGSYGGELGSRNTYSFFPHGFELVGRWLPDALTVNDRFLSGLESGLASIQEDDHHIGHHAWNYLLAWRDFVEDRPPTTPSSDGTRWLPEAGLFIDRQQGVELHVSTRKGGVFRLYRDGELVTQDTQVSLVVGHRSGRRNAVAHLVADNHIQLEPDHLMVAGEFGWAKQELMTTPKLIVLRLLMAIVGRLFPNLVRRLLQRRLIVGRRKAPFRFERRFERVGRQWRITDEIRGNSWREVLEAGIGSSQSSIYVTMSRTYQLGQLKPWMDLTPELRELRKGDPLVLERVL